MNDGVMAILMAPVIKKSEPAEGSKNLEGQIIVIKGHLKKKVLFLSRPKIGEGGRCHCPPLVPRFRRPLKKLLTLWTFVILTLSFHCLYESDIWIKETIYIQTAINGVSVRIRVLWFYNIFWVTSSQAMSPKLDTV